MRIGIAGTQSTGKTTLVNALKELPQFKGYEFRTERSKYLRDLGIPLNTDSTLKGQTIFLAERASELIEDNIITDRTVIDVMAFTQNAKSIKLKDKEHFNSYASLFIPEYDYIFYISPKGVEMEDNNVRETDVKYRQQIDNSIRKILDYYKFKIKNLHYIEGSTEERIEAIRKVIF